MSEKIGRTYQFYRITTMISLPCRVNVSSLHVIASKNIPCSWKKKVSHRQNFIKLLVLPRYPHCASKYQVDLLPVRSLKQALWEITDLHFSKQRLFNVKRFTLSQQNLQSECQSKLKSFHSTKKKKEKKTSFFSRRSTDLIPRKSQTAE